MTNQARKLVWLRPLVVLTALSVTTAATAEEAEKSGGAGRTHDEVALSFEGYRVVELSPRIVARLQTLDGEILEGAPDPYGYPLTLRQGTAPYDNSTHTLLGNPKDKEYPHPMHLHLGAHTEAGKGHIGQFDDLPDDMLELWEMPIDTFFGPAAVCNFAFLKPVEGTSAKGKSGLLGQAILPEHFAHVREGDIVLPRIRSGSLRANRGVGTQPNWE